MPQFFCSKRWQEFYCMHGLIYQWGTKKKHTGWWPPAAILDMGPRSWLTKIHGFGIKMAIMGLKGAHFPPKNYILPYILYIFDISSIFIITVFLRAHSIFKGPRRQFNFSKKMAKISIFSSAAIVLLQEMARILLHAWFTLSMGYLKKAHWMVATCGHFKYGPQKLTHQNSVFLD